MEVSMEVTEKFFWVFGGVSSEWKEKWFRLFWQQRTGVTVRFHHACTGCVRVCEHVDFFSVFFSFSYHSPRCRNNDAVRASVLRCLCVHMFLIQACYCILQCYNSRLLLFIHQMCDNRNYWLQLVSMGLMQQHLLKSLKFPRFSLREKYEDSAPDATISSKSEFCHIQVCWLNLSWS